MEHGFNEDSKIHDITYERKKIDWLESTLLTMVAEHEEMKYENKRLTTLVKNLVQKRNELEAEIKHTKFNNKYAEILGEEG